MRPRIIFSQQAWIKMTLLIAAVPTEIAWNGIVERKTENEFYIKDILVYPQKVSYATVDTDEAEYTEWRNSLTDEQFSGLRMHGHSHVNMSTSPSGTDLSEQRRIKEELKSVTDDFRKYYIFMIFNKSLEVSVRLYDCANETGYCEKDCDIVIDGIGSYIGYISDEYTKIISPADNSEYSLENEYYSFWDSDNVYESMYFDRFEEECYESK